MAGLSFVTHNQSAPQNDAGASDRSINESCSSWLGLCAQFSLSEGKVVSMPLCPMGKEGSSAFEGGHKRANKEFSHSQREDSEEYCGCSNMRRGNRTQFCCELFSCLALVA